LSGYINVEQAKLCKPNWLRHVVTDVSTLEYGPFFKEEAKLEFSVQVTNIASC
jgi:hypothetical protein